MKKRILTAASIALILAACILPGSFVKTAEPPVLTPAPASPTVTMTVSPAPSVTPTRTLEPYPARLIYWKRLAIRRGLNRR